MIYVISLLNQISTDNLQIHGGIMFLRQLVLILALIPTALLSGCDLLDQLEEANQAQVDSEFPPTERFPVMDLFVYDENGDPVLEAIAQATFYTDGDPLDHFTDLTDEDGYVFLSLQEAELGEEIEVVISAEGFNAFSKRVTVSEYRITEVVNLEVYEECENLTYVDLNIYAVDISTETPLDGAIVRMHFEDEDPLDTFTDALGSTGYELIIGVDTEITLEAFRGGYADYTSTFTIAAGVTEQTITLKMEKN